MAELGECAFCRRLLCVGCYDVDTERNNRCAALSRPDSRWWRAEAQRLEAEGFPVPEIAQRVGINRHTVDRVLRGLRP